MAMIVVVMTLSFMMTVFSMTFAIVPSAFPLPFVTTAHLFMPAPLLVSPPAAFIVTVVAAPVVPIAPAAAVPVITARIAVTNM
jgi:hypothetical protein